MAYQKQKTEALFTCPNDSCKRVFANPLKTLDFGVNSGEVYWACPYCLSKVSSSDKKVEAPLDEARSTPSERKNSCAHYLGYLWERPEKGQVPDECITCSDIIPCMLKGLKK